MNFQTLFDTDSVGIPPFEPGARRLVIGAPRSAEALGSTLNLPFSSHDGTRSRDILTVGN